jgi:hypothetical protein
VDRLMIILDRLGQEIEITVADRVRRSTRRPRSGAASNRRHARNPPAHP